MLWIVEFETASLDDEAEVDVRAVFQDSLRHVDRFEFDRPNQSTLGTSIDRAISVAWALISGELAVRGMLGAQGTVEPYSLCCSTLTRLSKSWKHSTSNKNCRMGYCPSWVGLGSRSQELLAWRIGEAIGNGVVAASREMVEALAIIYKGRSDDGPTEEEKKNTARFRRFVRWVLLGFVAVVILVVALFVGGAITIAILAIVIPVIAIALFSWTMRKFLVFAWEQARAEFKRNQAIDEYWFAFNRAPCCCVRNCTFLLDLLAVFGLGQGPLADDT